MTELKHGARYLVTKCPAWEYLTVGRVYVCDHVDQYSIGLHDDTGGGTWVRQCDLTDGYVVLEQEQGK